MDNKRDISKFCSIDRMGCINPYERTIPLITNRYNNNRGIIEWGKDNNFPNLILRRYNHEGSPQHTKIINLKNLYTTGQGFEDISDPRIAELFLQNNMNMEVSKMGLDYELFNGFAFKIVWNLAGDFPVKIKHVNLQKLRFGIPSKKLPFKHMFYSNDWNNYRKEINKPQLVRLYDDEEETTGTQIYYYSEYNPETDGLYPIPNYNTSLLDIDSASRISKFHNSNLKYGFAPSAIFKVNQNSLSPEAIDDFIGDLRRNRGGENNAGKDMVMVVDSVDDAFSIEPFNSNDSDEKFDLLQKSVISNIVDGSGIPPQLLILYGSQLGSVDEREELQAEFQSSYVSPRQLNIENVFNSLLKTDVIKLKKSDVINQQKNNTE